MLFSLIGVSIFFADFKSIDLLDFIRFEEPVIEFDEFIF